MCTWQCGSRHRDVALQQKRKHIISVLYISKQLSSRSDAPLHMRLFICPPPLAKGTAYINDVPSVQYLLAQQHTYLSLINS